MKKVSRIMSVLIAMLFVFSSLLTGCGSAADSAPADTESSANTESTAEESKAIDISKAVDLSMYLIGGPAKEYDQVLAEVNTKMKTDLNATLTVNWIGWGDFATKYPLVLASGEPIDLIYASVWTNFYTQAQKGAYLAIEDLAPVYAPESFAETTSDAIAQATVNGHLYALPPTFYQNAIMGYIVRGDLMDKYGITEINSIDDYGKFLDAVVKNDKNIDPTGFMATSDGLDKYFATTLNLYDILQNQYSPFYVDLDDPEAKVVNLFDRPEMPAFYAKMKEWADNGYWPKSVLSNKDENMLVDGKAASRLHNLDSWRSLSIEHPEYDARFFPGWAYSYQTLAMQDGMAIPASAKNPERGLMLLEKLRQDQSYYNLMTYGIEGKHYEINADDKLKALDLDAFAPEGYCSWGFKSLKFYKEPVGTPKSLPQVQEKIQSLVRENNYLLFTANMEPIKNENAAVNNVIQQYAAPLRLGYVDPVEGLATLKEKLKAAGIEKMQAELQNQINEYLKNKK